VKKEVVKMEKQVKVGLDRKQKEGAKARSNRLFGIIRNIYPRITHAEMPSFPTYEKTGDAKGYQSKEASTETMAMMLLMEKRQAIC
jgi:hypothetical protein